MYYLFRNLKHNVLQVSSAHDDLRFARELPEWELEDIFDNQRDAHRAKRDKDKGEADVLLVRDRP